MKKIKIRGGFSLIELMIVIAVIGLLIGIASLAWTSIIKNANEVSAIGYIDKISKAQAQYASKYQGKFAKSFDELIEDGSLDSKFSGEKPLVNGYIYEMRLIESKSGRSAIFTINADPEIDAGVGATGNRYFYLDPTLSSIRFTREKRQAKSEDDPV